MEKNFLVQTKILFGNQVFREVDICGIVGSNLVVACFWHKIKE